MNAEPRVIDADVRIWDDCAAWIRDNAGETTLTCRDPVQKPRLRTPLLRRTTNVSDLLMSMHHASSVELY
jgi:hypothetical protein